MHSDRLTNKSQQAFAAALSIARARRNPQVTPNHLLVALLEQEGGIVVPVLQRANADPEGLRRRANQALEKFGRDLTKAAQDGKLDPVIGRDDEIRRVIQVLSRRTKNNPVLIGEPGVGKTAIVEG